MVFWVIIYQISIIRRISPTFDLAAVDPEGVAALGKLFAVLPDFIAPCKIAFKVRAGVCLVGTQPAVPASEVSIPVAPDLLGVGVPV